MKLLCTYFECTIHSWFASVTTVSVAQNWVTFNSASSNHPKIKCLSTRAQRSSTKDVKIDYWQKHTSLVMARHPEIGWAVSQLVLSLKSCPCVVPFVQEMRPILSVCVYLCWVWPRPRPPTSVFVLIPVHSTQPGKKGKYNLNDRTGNQGGNISFHIFWLAEAILPSRGDEMIFWYLWVNTEILMVSYTKQYGKGYMGSCGPNFRAYAHFCDKWPVKGCSFSFGHLRLGALRPSGRTFLPVVPGAQYSAKEDPTWWVPWALCTIKEGKFCPKEPLAASNKQEAQSREIPPCRTLSLRPNRMGIRSSHSTQTSSSWLWVNNISLSLVNRLAALWFHVVGPRTSSFTHLEPQVLRRESPPTLRAPQAAQWRDPPCIESQALRREIPTGRTSSLRP